MCGIAGAIGYDIANGQTVVSKMMDASIHRGPDQSGLYASQASPVTLGHRRLAILDLSDIGRQPMTDPGTGVTIVYNGECYNYLELRRELQRAGHTFNSTSDTEVVLRSYVHWGLTCLDRLRGMFGMAIWDPRIEKAFLVRDRIGIKPVYYALTGRGLLFASEARALLASQELHRHINSRALTRYVWNGFVSGPESLVDGVRRLEPGSWVRISVSGEIEEERSYWRLPTRHQDRSPSTPEEVRAALHDSVKGHLQSDVPVGVFLSGGVDSSVVAAVAQQHSESSVSTFCIRFEEGSYDESMYARRIAEKIGTDHQELTLTETEFSNCLDQALESLDQPTFDAVNTYFVSRAVKQAGITVALAGTGGDELFGGYSSFGELPKARRLSSISRVMPTALSSMAARVGVWMATDPLSEIPSQVRLGKTEGVLLAQGDLVSLYQQYYGLYSRDFVAQLLARPSESIGWGIDSRRASTLRQEIREEEVLPAISRLEISSFLGERLLPDTDTCSMAVSLEVRVPLIDHVFVEAVHRLPSDQRYSPPGRKQFLIDSVAGVLGSNVFDRKKAGFELPLASWCLGRLAPEIESTFKDVNLALSIGLDPEALGRMWRSFKSGATGLYWSRIWAMYVLMKWCRLHRLTTA